MKKRKTKVIIALLFSAVWLTALAQPAKAAQVSSGEIPITIDLGDSLTGEEFEIELKAEDSAYPMPEGSKDGVYTVNITGAATSKLPEIDYTSVGIYTYIISQKIKLEDSYNYDTKEYFYKVQIFRSEATGGLQAESTLRDLEQSSREGAKVGDGGAVFYNTPRETGVMGAVVEFPPKETKPATGVKGATIEIPTTSDNTVIFPYVGLFISSLGLVSVLLLDIRKKAKGYFENR